MRTRANTITDQVANQVNNGHDQLFFDGQCPLCTAEMGKLARHKPSSLELVDVHVANITCEQKTSMIKRLHYRRANGEWVTGIDANILAWQNTPYAPLWRVLGWPGIHFLASCAYNVWAAWRFKRLKHIS